MMNLTETRKWAMEQAHSANRIFGTKLTLAEVDYLSAIIEKSYAHGKMDCGHHGQVSPAAFFSLMAAKEK